MQKLRKSATRTLNTMIKNYPLELMGNGHNPKHEKHVYFCAGIMILVCRGLIVISRSQMPDGTD
jgi:hypothetical protein